MPEKLDFIGKEGHNVTRAEKTLPFQQYIRWEIFLKLLCYVYVHV